MTELYRLMFFIILLFQCNLCLTASILTPAQEPDSVYTREYVLNISISEPYRALRLIDEMEARHQLPGYKLNDLRSIVYQNGLGMYRTALNYSLKAYRSDSIPQQPTTALQLLERITDQYNVTGNYTESTRYAIEGIKLAQKTGDKQSEANFLLYLGINKRDMRLKKQADEQIDEAIRLYSSITPQTNTWNNIDDLIYMYGVKFTYLIEDGNYQRVIDLLPHMEHLLQQLKTCSDLPEGVYDMRLSIACQTFALCYASIGQTVKGEEYYRKYLQTNYASENDGLRMRFDYLIITGRYAEALQFIHEDKQLRRAENDTVNYLYIDCNLKPEAQAYEGLGDYKSAAQVYKQMWILSDSLRIREIENGVIEFATLYETNEKEAQLAEQVTRIRVRNAWLVSTAAAFLVLLVLFVRKVQYARTVRNKNISMVHTIQELRSYRDKLHRAEAKLTVLQAKATSRAGLSPTPLEEMQEECDEDSILFQELDRIVTTEKLFTRQNLSRDDLMKCIGVDKNRLARILQQNIRTSVTGYLNDKRMEYAAELIEAHPEYNIATIAEMCGISVSTLNRTFKNKYKMTPKDFRDCL